jgi:hypothetical protein
MPARLIRDDMLDSERVQTLPVEARWLFVSIMLSADDVGLFEAGTFRLARKAGIDVGPCQTHMQSLVDADLIRLYMVDGRHLGFVPRFRQKLKIQRTKYPLPPDALMADDADAIEKVRIFERTAAGEIATPFGKKWEQLRSAVLERDGACIRCDSDDRLTAHHVLPKSKGGEHEGSNLVALCVHCNSWARNNEQRCSEIKDLAQKRYPDGIPNVSGGTLEPEPEPEPEEASIAPTVLVGRKAPDRSTRDGYRLSDTPYEELIALYHEALPMLPRFVLRNKTRDAYMRARWAEVCGSERWSKAEGLQFFADFFAGVKRSAFLTGRAPGHGDRQPFKADLEWLMKPNNFTKTLEGRYVRS